MQTHWIFPLQAPLSEEEAAALAQRIRQSLAGWQAHGSPIRGEAVIRAGRFVFVQATDLPSGCSIDWMRTTIAELAGECGHALAEPGKVFFRQPGGEVGEIDFRDAGERIASGELGPETVIFDHTVANENRFEPFEKPLRESWLSRYLPSHAG